MKNRIFLYIFSILFLTQSIHAISCKRLCKLGSYEACQRMILGELECSHNDSISTKLTPKAQKYLTACNKGDGKSCILLGAMYEKGNGIKKDYTKAKKLYSQGCDNTFYLGCSLLASMYAKGKLIPQDITKAITLYKHACTNNEGHACTNLGRIYSEGKVRDIDIETAQKYNKKGCDLGMDLGCQNYAYLSSKAKTKKSKKSKDSKDFIHTVSGSLEIINSVENGININTLINHAILNKTEDVILSIKKKFTIPNSTIALISENYGGSGTTPSYYFVEIFKDGSTYISKSFSSMDYTFKIKKSKAKIIIDLGFKDKKHLYAIYANKKLLIQEKKETHSKINHNDCKWLYKTVYLTYINESVSCKDRIGFIIGNSAYHGYYALTQNPSFYQKEFEDLLHYSCQTNKKETFKHFENYICKHTQAIKMEKSYKATTKTYLYLIPKIKLPTKTKNVFNTLSKPTSSDLNGPNEDAPWGHTFKWKIKNKIISIWSDAQQAYKIDYSASVRMIHLQAKKNKKITTLYGTVINKDTYKTVHKKILSYAYKLNKKRNSLQVIKWDFYGYKPTIVFKDPKTKLYNIFYFKNGILKKVSQGLYDLSQAG